MRDSNMFAKRIRDEYNNNQGFYASVIVDRIKDLWRKEVSEWIACPSEYIKSPFLFDSTYAVDFTCPQRWALEANIVLK